MSQTLHTLKYRMKKTIEKNNDKSIEMEKESKLVNRMKKMDMHWPNKEKLMCGFKFLFK